MSKNTLKVYGIPNCDTVKKVLAELDAKKIAYTFVNFKTHVPNDTLMQTWQGHFGEALPNRKGPTFRKIKDEYDAASKSQQRKILIENTSAIKRPIVERGQDILFHGYDEKAMAQI